MHKFRVEEKLRKIMIKLAKRERDKYEALANKISRIINSENIDHYKNLRYNMKSSQRAHIGHFVLVFSYDKEKDLISFEDYAHHDNIYK